MSFPPLIKRLNDLEITTGALRTHANNLYCWEQQIKGLV